MDEVTVKVMAGGLTLLFLGAIGLAVVVCLKSMRRD